MDPQGFEPWAFPYLAFPAQEEQIEHAFQRKDAVARGTFCQAELRARNGNSFHP